MKFPDWKHALTEISKESRFLRPELAADSFSEKEVYKKLVFNRLCVAIYDFPDWERCGKYDKVRITLATITVYQNADRSYISVYPYDDSGVAKEFSGKSWYQLCQIAFRLREPIVIEDLLKEGFSH